MVTPCQRTSSSPASRWSEQGYNLVILMVLVTLMNIAIAVALPTWSNVAKREKEEELIFRGFQYAEAIRVFQKNHGRLPISLEELVEREPRSIRQLFKDPITGGDWGLLVQGGPGGGANATGTTQTGSVADRNRNTNLSEAARELAENPPTGVGFAGSPGSQASQGAGGGNVVAIPPAPKSESSSRLGGPTRRTTGPIVGVFSASGEKALRSFQGLETYSQWQFRTDMLPMPVIVGDGAAPRVTAAWIGKPFRKDLQVQPGGMPGGGVPAAGGAPGGPQPAGGSQPGGLTGPASGNRPNATQLRPGGRRN